MSLVTKYLLPKPIKLRKKVLATGELKLNIIYNKNINTTKNHTFNSSRKQLQTLL